MKHYGNLKLTGESTISAASGTLYGVFTKLSTQTDGTEPSIESYRFGRGNYPIIKTYKSNGTMASPTSASTGDIISAYNSYFYNGTTYKNGASILTYLVDTSPSTGSASAMYFSVCKRGETATSVAIKIEETLNLKLYGTINKLTLTQPATAATLTLADNSSLITSGAYSTTLTSTNTTNVTLPITGTLSTLAGSETLTNKTINGAITKSTAVTGTSATLTVGTTHIIEHASTRVDLALPSTSAKGDILDVVYSGAGSWKITQSANQKIMYGDVSTTSGTGGSLEGTSVGSCVTLRCITANLVWRVIASHGTLTQV